MAEFCLDCLNKLLNNDLKEKDVKLLPDLCEGCGKIKPTVVYVKALLPSHRSNNEKRTGN
ncbi:MAG TPA: hypothetical protein VFD03_09705 [Clostridia bacterium]|nr:hypothetical protein [Clostridia bacterium]